MEQTPESSQPPSPIPPPTPPLTSLELELFGDHSESEEGPGAKRMRMPEAEAPANPSSPADEPMAQMCSIDSELLHSLPDYEEYEEMAATTMSLLPILGAGGMEPAPEPTPRAQSPQPNNDVAMEEDSEPPVPPIAAAAIQGALHRFAELAHNRFVFTDSPAATPLANIARNDLRQEAAALRAEADNLRNRATAMQQEQTHFTEEQTEHVTLRAADTRAQSSVT